MAAAKGIARPEPAKGDEIADRTFAKRVLPRRKAGAHKWGVGGVLVVAGGPTFIGAAALTALGAGRAGAGIVNLVVPRSLMGPLSTLVPEAGFVPLPDGDVTNLERRLMSSIEEKIEKCKALIVGPGLGQDEYSVALVRRLLNVGQAESKGRMGFGQVANVASDEERSAFTWSFPVLVDADGLNILSTIPDWWEKMPPNRLVLTPHVGELARLMDTDADTLLADPRGAALAAAKRFKQTVVFKFGYSVASDGERCVIAEDAPTSTASAGTGDVFAGVIGAFLAQGVEPLDAAGLAMYTGSRAARAIEASVGTLGLVAGDLPIAIAQELASLERE